VGPIWWQYNYPVLSDVIRKLDGARRWAMSCPIHQWKRASFLLSVAAGVPTNNWSPTVQEKSVPGDDSFFLLHTMLAE
jgi:hypothetical protein